MGVATILDAREIAIIATGEHKATIVQRAVEGEIDVEVAATFLQRHPNTTFYVDRAAAAELTRIKTPWLLDEVQWTPGADHARRDLAVAADRQGDSQAHAARLRRRAHVVARREVRLAGRGERQGLQHARRQDPRQVQARHGPTHHLLLAASGRRRDLDGRHSPQARRERQRHHRGVHDERQHRRVRSRRAALRGLPRAPRRRGTGRSPARSTRSPRAFTSAWSERRRAKSTSPRCRTSSGSFAKPKR